MAERFEPKKEDEKSDAKSALITGTGSLPLLCACVVRPDQHPSPHVHEGSERTIAILSHK